MDIEYEPPSRPSSPFSFPDDSTVLHPPGKLDRHHPRRQKDRKLSEASNSETAVDVNAEAVKNPMPGGIPGVRPSIDRGNSPCGVGRSIAPVMGGDGFCSQARKAPNLEEDEGFPDARGKKFRKMILGDVSEGSTGIASYSTTNAHRAPALGPNDSFMAGIKSWVKGQCLGSGSYGTVYKAKSNEGVLFAVKEVSLVDQGIEVQHCVTQLEQEIALLSRFNHKNIVQYLGTHKDDSKLFIFLELATEGSLASLYQKQILRESQVSAYTKQILNGLNYLHELQVVHRDIKCANILVHGDGTAKLADFGLAKEITNFNKLQSCKGSVYWMAPEVNPLF